MTAAADLSIVIPILNEREALPGLLDEIEAACASPERRLEVIVVDDGSTDGSFELLESLAAERPWLRGIRLRRNFGKSAALATGFAAASGDGSSPSTVTGRTIRPTSPLLLARARPGQRPGLGLEARAPGPGEQALGVALSSTGSPRASAGSRCTT